MKSQTIRVTFFSSISLIFPFEVELLEHTEAWEAFSKQGIHLDSGWAPGLKSAYIRLKKMD